MLEATLDHRQPFRQIVGDDLEQELGLFIAGKKRAAAAGFHKRLVKYDIHDSLLQRAYISLSLRMRKTPAVEAYHLSHNERRRRRTHGTMDGDGRVQAQHPVAEADTTAPGAALAEMGRASRLRARSDQAFWSHLWRGFAACLSAGANLVYPPVCRGCGRHVVRHGAVCPSCWASLRLIERPFCEVLGVPFSHDLGRGILSADAIAHPPPFDRLRSVALHAGIARDLVHALKYTDRTDLAPMMAAWMVRASEGAVAASDAIVPVPLHMFRLWSRRYNQSAELARAISALSGRPMLSTALVRRRRTARQVGLGVAQRQDNVRGAFAVTDDGRASVFGRRLVLVDDVYTTGATVAAATRALKAAGASEVTVLTFARALAAPI
jgi:ComF family protein